MAKSQRTPSEAGAFSGACQSPRVAFPYWLLSPLSGAAPCLHLATSVSVTWRRRSGWRRRAWSSVLPWSLLLVTRCCFSNGTPSRNTGSRTAAFPSRLSFFLKIAFFCSYFYNPFYLYGRWNFLRPFNCGALCWNAVKSLPTLRNRTKK